MHKFIIRISLTDAFYFSFISFIILLGASFLFEALEKTTGKLNMGPTLIIVFSIITVLFFLAITNIVLREPHGHRKRIKFWERIVGVLIFILTSAVILGILSFLFWFEI